MRTSVFFQAVFMSLMAHLVTWSTWWAKTRLSHQEQLCLELRTCGHCWWLCASFGKNSQTWFTEGRLSTAWNIGFLYEGTCRQENFFKRVLTILHQWTWDWGYTCMGCMSVKPFMCWSMSWIYWGTRQGQQIRPRRMVGIMGTRHLLKTLTGATEPILDMEITNSHSKVVRAWVLCF